MIVMCLLERNEVCFPGMQKGKSFATPEGTGVQINFNYRRIEKADSQVQKLTNKI